VAHFSDGSTVEDIAKIAERRLYVAKETGRNQVISKG
jgi:PleD family two-component response regulator